MISGGTAESFNVLHTAFRGMGTPSVLFRYNLYPTGANRFALLFVFIGGTLSTLLRGCCGQHSNHQ